MWGGEGEEGEWGGEGEEGQKGRRGSRGEKGRRGEEGGVGGPVPPHPFILQNCVLKWIETPIIRSAQV